MLRSIDEATSRTRTVAAAGSRRVLGLLFHGAEHTCGTWQLLVTVRVLGSPYASASGHRLGPIW